MRNKIISILLILSLLNTNLFAILDEGNSTKGGKWTDPTTGMKYYSFGKKHYSFKKRVNTFTPWMKIRPPSIKAGCGGISLDGGFASFINLEEIGKQLEEAMSSIGMGVIVVLIQTLPSIGKAFEDIQKMVKKFQELLQNACQMTVTALSSMPQVANAQKEMQDGVDNFLGNNWIAKQAKGATEAMENFEKSIDCGGSADSNCLQNQAMKKIKGLCANIVKGYSYNELGSKSLNALPSMGNQDPGKFTKSPIKDLLEGKFNNKSIPGFNDSAINMLKLKMAIFGVLAAPYDASISNKLKDGEDTIDLKEASKAFAEGSSNSSGLVLKHYSPMNSAEDVAKFFTYEEIDKDNTTILKVPTHFDVVSLTTCSSSTAEGGCQGSKNYLAYYEAWQEGINDETDYVELEWKGIHKNTRENILHYIDPTKYNKPSDNVGLFVPGIDTYLDIVKESYVRLNKNTETIDQYIDFLTARNVKSALYMLQEEIKAAAYEIDFHTMDDPNISSKQAFLENAKAVLKVIEETIKNLPTHYLDADTVILFNELDKANKAKRTNVAQ